MKAAEDEASTLVTYRRKEHDAALSLQTEEFKRALSRAQSELGAKEFILGPGECAVHASAFDAETKSWPLTLETKVPFLSYSTRLDWSVYDPDREKMRQLYTASETLIRANGLGGEIRYKVAPVSGAGRTMYEVSIVYAAVKDITSGNRVLASSSRRESAGGLEIVRSGGKTSVRPLPYMVRVTSDIPADVYEGDTFLGKTGEVFYFEKGGFRTFNVRSEGFDIEIVQKTLVPSAVTELSVDLLSVDFKTDFVYVAGGTFSMGSAYGFSFEKPVHAVTVSDFFMAKTEVTQKEFKELMGFNPSNFKGDNLPVEQVTWYDALAFCNAKSRKEGLKEVYTVSWVRKDSDGNITSADVSVDWSASGYRLPTEAEWEWAARGGKSSCGYTYAGGNDAGSVAWYDGNSRGKTQAVGTKSPNELGIYDLSGNVWEWCWDWWEGYVSSSQTDPKGPSSGSNRVIRGGSWDYNVSFLRASYRGSYTPNSRYFNIGFRPVRTN